MLGDLQGEVGAALGLLGRRVEADLGRFKRYIEARGVETGGRRGEIEPGAPNDGQSQLRPRGSA
jgi:hypothetical protein